jgi:hypothetical protein
VRKGLFIVLDPHTPHDEEKRKLKVEWLRPEAEVQAAGGWWPEVPFRRSEGMLR